MNHVLLTKIGASPCFPATEFDRSFRARSMQKLRKFALKAGEFRDLPMDVFTWGRGNEHHPTPLVGTGLLMNLPPTSIAL